MSKLFEKIFIKKTEKKEDKNVGIKDRVIENVKKIFSFFPKEFVNLKVFGADIKKKFLNLSETNYNVGINHFNKGNIWDATFRFKFIDKRWPDYKDEKYYLAYCYALNERYTEAKNILNKFLEKNKTDARAKKLLEILENNDIEALAEDYENVVKKTLLKSA